MTKQDRAGGHPSRIHHGRCNVEQLALHGFAAHGLDRWEEHRYIPPKVSPQCVDASVTLRGLQEIPELEHERLALLDGSGIWCSSARLALNLLVEPFPEMLILVAHRLQLCGRVRLRAPCDPLRLTLGLAPAASAAGGGLLLSQSPFEHVLELV